MHDILLDQNMTGPFVVVDSPTTIVVRIDVVDVIAPEHRTWRNTQRVDTAHVGQEALANVMYMIELNNIVTTDTTSVSPYPADRHSSVKSVMDIVVCHVIGRSVHQQYANGRRVLDTIRPDLVVADRIRAGAQKRVMTVRAPIDANSAGAQLGQPIRGELIVRAALRQLESEGPGFRNLTMAKLAVPAPSRAIAAGTLAEPCRSLEFPWGS